MSRANGRLGVMADHLPVWPGVKLPRAILAKGRSPIDGAATRPWPRWVLADQGYVLHVTYSLDPDGPWVTSCGNNPMTGRIVERLVDQGKKLRFCGQCHSYDRSPRGSIELRLTIEGYRLWPPHRQYPQELWVIRDDR